jgi:hypothetical protein
MTQRLLAFFYATFFILFSCIGWGQIYVAPNGADLNNGSSSQPKATLQSALRQARELRRLQDPAIKNGIHINIKGGSYFLDEPLFIRPEDAGTDESPTWIEAARGTTCYKWRLNNQALEQGANKYSGDHQAANGKLWVADMH